MFLTGRAAGEICFDQAYTLPRSGYLAVARHQNGISALVTKTFQGGEICSGVAKRRLFSLTKYINKIGLMKYSFFV